MIDLVVFGVTVSILELLLRIFDYLHSRKNSYLGNSEKTENDNKKTKQNRKKIEKIRT